MQLYLIQDCTTSHVIDAIELVQGYKISSCLSTAAKKHGLDPKYVSYLTRFGSTSSFEVFEDSSLEIEDGNYGIWFLVYVLDFISINCDTKQIEWCFRNKLSSCIKYLEDEEYNLNLEEIFDHSQRLIDYMEDPEFNAVDRHQSLEHLLFNQILPRVVISQQEVDLLAQALATQEDCIRTLNKQLETLNHTSTACKSTLYNLKLKLLPDLVKYSQMRTLYPEATVAMARRIELEMGKLKKSTLSPETHSKLEELNTALKHLHKKSKKSVSKGWRSKHSELIEEKGPVLDIYVATEDDLDKAREMEVQTLKAKVKATQVKEELRNVQHRLKSEPETYGYDLPSTYSSDSITHSHLSLYDAVLGIIQDVSQEVGRKHMIECNWIIEQCKLTEMAWTENPEAIPCIDKMCFDRIDEDFVLVSEPDIFTLILDKISTQCVFAVGRLLKVLPRIQSTPSATKRLILTYETIVYRRVADYILPLFELRYKGVLDKLTKDIRLMSWQELDVEEEWLINLLSTDSPADDDTMLPDSINPMSPNSTYPMLPNGINPMSPNSTYPMLPNGINPMSPNSTYPLLPNGINPTQKTVQSAADSTAMATSVSPDEPTTSYDSLAGPEPLLASSAVSRGHTRCRSASRCQSDSGYHDMCQSPSESTLLPQLTADHVPESHTTLSAPDPSRELHQSSAVSRTIEGPANEPEEPDSSTTISTSATPSSNHSLQTQQHDITQPNTPHNLSVQSSEQTDGVTGNESSYHTATSGDDSFHSTTSTHNTCTTPAGDSPQTTARSLPSVDGQPAGEGGDAVGSPEPPAVSGSSVQEVPEAAADVSTELDELLDEAMATLDEGEEKTPAAYGDIPLLQINVPARFSRTRSAEPESQGNPSSRKFSSVKGRSKSVGAKSKIRWNKSTANTDKPTSPGSPLSPMLSPRRVSAQQKTRRDVQSVLSKRRSRRYQSRRCTTEAHKTSSVLGGSNLFTSLFKDCIKCLTDMHLCHSPLEKAQMLAKCLRCMSATITEVKEGSNSPTCSDDLITVAIVLLLNIPTEHFRSIYIQLKFISTYMDEFMDAGIHNFACVQFIGAMHFIQDQILTKKYRITQPQNESSC